MDMYDVGSWVDANNFPSTFENQTEDSNAVLIQNLWNPSNRKRLICDFQITTKWNFKTHKYWLRHIIRRYIKFYCETKIIQIGRLTFFIYVKELNYSLQEVSGIQKQRCSQKRRLNIHLQLFVINFPRLLHYR